MVTRCVNGFAPLSISVSSGSRNKAGHPMPSRARIRASSMRTSERDEEIRGREGLTNIKSEKPV
ncbi:hypothetical protein BC829DRAFT_390168 [Chytridium lagenaria]|nr:hypothetical protein BC829DRAFT_390168 [Chytridium lagenaria]